MAACRKTYAGRALFLVKNSASSLVKMSFVTAAMEKRVRRCLQRVSMSAVLPEPTGLAKSVLNSYVHNVEGYIMSKARSRLIE